MGRGGIGTGFSGGGRISGGSIGGGRSSGGRAGGGRSSGGGGSFSARSSGGRSAGGVGSRFRTHSLSGRPRAGYSASSFHIGNFCRASASSQARARTAFRGNASFNALYGAISIAIGVLIIVAPLAACFAVIPVALSLDLDITKSTIKREKLDSQYVTETKWFTDELGWIESSRKLARGMRSFYDKTGVQPYLYITDTVNGTTYPLDEDMETYARALYEELFSDEGHILLLFYERDSNARYKTQYVAGAAAKSVMDGEACDILLDYVDYYYGSDLADDAMFAAAFKKAGNRIMRVTRSPLITLTIALIRPFALFGILLLVASIVVDGWNPISAIKAKKALKNRKKAEELERALNAGFVEDPALKALEEKYK